MNLFDIIKNMHNFIALSLLTGVFNNGSYPESKLSGVIIHSTRVHQGESVSDSGRVEDFLPRHRTDPAISEGSSNDRGRFTSHFNGAQL